VDKLLVKVAGQVHDDREIALATEALMSGSWASGKFAGLFSRRLAEYLGVRDTILCNSGSSANLLAVSALTSPKLGYRALKKGDLVAVAATSFPTTVAPIIQNGLTPVFIDVDKVTCNISPVSFRASLVLQPKVVIIAHTLGNPFNLDVILELCKENDIWLIEDNCDALGSEWRGRKTGSFGDMSTQSFYPAHHISTGEGGAVSTRTPLLKTIIESFRDWGRDCWCDPGKDNTCGKRFLHDFPPLPTGYDHKYTYSHIGYNLKMTDIQAALGLAQMEKIDDFVEARRRNHSMIYDALSRYDNFFYTQGEEFRGRASWFGFLITLRGNQAFSRAQLIHHLEEYGIATRMLFGGNLWKQPAFNGKGFVFEKLDNADFIMNNSFWIGCWPGLAKEHIDHIGNVFEDFMRRY
jgi:CDP-6-deoxy-D-xylo-4-hexulose-3-dehydrase